MHSNTFIALFAAVAGIASAAPSSGGSPGGGSDKGITPSGGKSRLSPEEIESTMKEHNRYRNACGMKLLQWDDDLAGSAQAWADKMPGTLEHSEDGPDRPGYGENLAWSTDGDAGSMTKQWTDEAEICESKCSFNKDVGHYTQIVWEGTEKCGCAIGPQNQFVCHYYPPGNYNNEEATNVCPNGLDRNKLGEDFNNDFKSGGGGDKESPAGGDKGGKPDTGHGGGKESPSAPDHGKRPGEKPTAPPSYKPAPPAKSPEQPTRRPQKPNKEHEKPEKQHQRPQKPEEDCDDDKAQSPQQPRPPKQRPQRRPQRPQKPEEDCDDDDKSPQKPSRPSKPVYEAKEAKSDDSSSGHGGRGGRGGDHGDDSSSGHGGRGGRGGDHGDDSGSDKGFGGKSDEDCDESKKI